MSLWSLLINFNVCLLNKVLISYKQNLNVTDPNFLMVVFALVILMG